MTQAVLDTVSISIWPTTVSGWLTLVGSVVLLTTALGGALATWLNRKLGVLEEHLRADFNGLGKRVAATEADITTNTEAIRESQKKQQASEFDRAGLHEDFGALKSVLDGINESVESLRVTHDRDARVWIDQLARIETKLGSQ